MADIVVHPAHVKNTHGDGGNSLQLDGSAGWGQLKDFDKWRYAINGVWATKFNNEVDNIFNATDEYYHLGRPPVSRASDVAPELKTTGPAYPR